MQTADEVLAAVQQLGGKTQRRLFDKLTNAPKTIPSRRSGRQFTDTQRLFVSEYVIDCNTVRAGRAVGYVSNPDRLLDPRKYPQVVGAIMDKLVEREEKSELKADYVRAYIQSILEFCPGDYFRAGPDGSWCIGQEGYDDLPQHVRRLIEEMTLINVNGVCLLSVRFISKTAALAMAAKYTLTQTINAQVSQVPWDEIAKGLENQAQPSIEMKLLEFDEKLSHAEPTEKSA